MDMALDLAIRGQGFTAPNPMVGAVVVNRGRVVGRGYHEAVGQAHAEVNAIDDAGPLAKGATLYVTLEPCNHTGRTPPCTHKIIDAGISRVVVAMQDPNPDVEGNGNRYLQDKGLKVDVGIGENRARRMNEAFVKYIRTKRPFVIVKCAATLDGRIATRTGDSKWVSGEASRAYVHRLRHAVDAIMVGMGTVETDDPSLTTRLEDGPGSDPKRIILDSNLSISRDARVLHLDSAAETWIVTGPAVSDQDIQALASDDVRIIKVPLKNGGIDLDHLMVELGRAGVASLLIEGGGKVIASALQAGIVDKVNLFYAPKILGGDDGVPICRGNGPANMADSIGVKNIEIHRFGNDVMLEGYIDKTGDR